MVVESRVLVVAEAVVGAVRCSHVLLASVDRSI